MFVLAMEFSKELRRPSAALHLATGFGGHGGGVTPVPIPNTEVKPSSADGTWVERPWESRTPPSSHERRTPSDGGPSSFSRPVGSRRSAPIPCRSPPASSSGRGRPPRVRRAASRPGAQARRPPAEPAATARARGRRGSGGEADAEQAQEGRLGRRGPQGRRPHARRRAAGDASKAFRAATPEGREPWEPEVWIDEGDGARRGRRGAVGRGRAPRPPPAGRRRRGRRSPPTRRCAGPSRPASRRAGSTQRLKDASQGLPPGALRGGPPILRPLAEAAPTAESVRELLGLTYYRLGRWKRPSPSSRPSAT